jgi:hypothetical protein
MSNKSYHNYSENSNSTERPNHVSQGAAEQAKDSASHKEEGRKESADGVSRHSQHHLPWDRFSKPKITLRLNSKPSITANIPDLSELASQVWAELRKLNQPSFLYRRENKLCRIEADDSGAPVPVSVDAQRMHFLLVKLFDWTREDEEGEEEKVRPPRDLAPYLVADPDPPVPTLRRIVTAPLFTAAGRLLDKPGDHADGILYLPPKSFRLAALPEKSERR